ncbi:DUF423 domain-containing protein [Formosa sediminum]|uniref:DUF423 domain-containing protein n=1 Tax=Formosa sediminum TaxID=2594004 RepID=A0A516GQC9_9FLAO|nr:DUF423 domain-containing protein [Formosa sediminum]QDO93737.1 DUF423 domain-containing protein [Formosa sediminum]
MTQHTIIATAALFGMLSVIFGAFGAHALKKKLTTEQLHSFEIGVKYQMYHALALLAIGLGFNTMLPASIYWCFTIGIVLFSFSIYGLVLSDARGKKIKLFGPITPLGGLLLVIGWFLLLLKML